MKRFTVLSLLLVAWVAAGCTQPRSAVETIQEYLRAKVESGDETQLISLSCADYEAQARTDATSFANIDATIESMDCTEAGAEGDAAVIACEGKIAAIYGAGDERELGLGGPYLAVQEDGEWKMCGVAEGGEASDG